MLERDLERKLTLEVKRLGGMCLKWVCPGNRGVPDRIVLLPGGRAFFIELKRPGRSKTDPLQEYWARMLRLMGFEARIVRGTEELEEAVKAFKGR